jgi:ribosome-binding protein aMBF1 (putative translation factor)
MFSSRADVQIHGHSQVLSQTIKECRMALNMSPEQLARMIKKTPEFVQDLEKAKVAIDSQVLEDCAWAFGLSAAEMVEIAVSEAVLVVAGDQSPHLQLASKKCAS